MITPKRRYIEQKQSARRRNVDFSINFEDWWEIWEQSGHWDNRGRGKGKYVMSRYNDTGPYEKHNVFIQLCEDNARQGVSGLIRSLETRKKMSNYGKNKTEEHRKKLSEAATIAHQRRKNYK